MKRLAIKRLAIALIAAMLLAPVPAAQAAKKPSGTYRGKIKSGFLRGTWQITFYGHGTRYKIRDPFGTTTGKTRFAGSTVTFYGEKDLQAICHLKAGKYRYRLTRTTLKMAPIKDPCAQRRKVNSILYRKIR